MVSAIALVAPSTETARAQSGSAAPPACGCAQLASLQAELRNAMRLEHRFRTEAKRLKKMEDASDATREYERFAREAARDDLEPVPGGEVREVSYVSRGSELSRTELTSALNNDRVPDADLCARTRANERDFARALSDAVCRDIARALREQGDDAARRCAASGFAAHSSANAVDRANAEADAYDRQIVRLRAAIIRILNETGLRVDFDARQTTAGGRRTRVEIAQRGEARLGKTKAIASDLFQMEGDGQARVDMQVQERACSASRPVAYDWAAIVTTDGLSAEIQFRKEKWARRQVRARCEATSAPLVSFEEPYPPAWVRLPLESGSVASVPEERSHDPLNGRPVEATVRLHVCE
jgi:hypothetical protein